MDEAIPDADDEPRVRSTGVSIIAVLAIIFGVFNFCCAPIGMGQMLFLKDPVNASMRNDSMLYYSTMVGGAINWFLAIILMTLGIGLWQLKEWARKGMVIYAILISLWTLLSGTFSMIYVTPKAMEIAMAAQMAAQNQKMPADAMKMVMFSTMAATGCMLVLIFCVYIGVAIYLTRARVKDAFRPQRT